MDFIKKAISTFFDNVKGIISLINFIPYLISISPLKRLTDKLNTEPDKFKTFYNAQEAENYIPYEDMFNHNKKLAAFLKLMFVREMRDDRTIICATQQFVPTVLDDKDFLNPYP